MRCFAAALVLTVGCSPSGSRDLSAAEVSAYARALRALATDPALAQGPHAERGFCVGLVFESGNQARVADPSRALMSALVDLAIPVYPASECETRDGWGDRRHKKSGAPTAALVLSPLVEADGARHLSAELIGGPYGDASYTCRVPLDGDAAGCELRWLRAAGATPSLAQRPALAETPKKIPSS